MGAVKPFFYIPYNLLHLHMIPGYVQALKETNMCPYSPFSPTAPTSHTIRANIIENFSLNILKLKCSKMKAHIVGLEGAVGYTEGIHKGF